MNEFILIFSVVLIFTSTILFFKFFGSYGLFAITVFSTITANIEVLILVKAFGMEQTLGNVLFASTFLCTDIASEIYGKEMANKVVKLGIFTSIFFVILTQSWLLYTPAEGDFAFPHIKAIFSNTPRPMIVGLIVYAICQKFDVWMYHKIWNKTKSFSDKKKFLWLRNNGSTMLSQLVNTTLFTFGTFLGIYDMPTLLNILVSSYVIFLILALVDTGFMYFARFLFEKGLVENMQK